MTSLYSKKIYETINVSKIINDVYDLSYEFVDNILHNISQLGKRKYADSFDVLHYEDARYGHHVSNDYFNKGGVGHGIVIHDERKLDIEEGGGNMHQNTECSKSVDDEKKFTFVPFVGVEVTP